MELLQRARGGEGCEDTGGVSYRSERGGLSESGAYETGKNTSSIHFCHAHIAKCFITLAGIINILDTEAVHMTPVWTGLDTKCRTDHQHCSTLMRTLQTLGTGT